MESENVQITGHLGSDPMSYSREADGGAKKWRVLLEITQSVETELGQKLGLQIPRSIFCTLLSF